MIDEIKFQKIYDATYCKKLLETLSDEWKKVRFFVSPSEFGVRDSYHFSFLLKLNFETYLEQMDKKEIVIKLCEDKILFLNRTQGVKKKITIRIPYENFDQSYEFIYQVNRLTSSDGLVNIFANNILYGLEFGLNVETLTHYEEIISLAEEEGYQLDYEFGLDELFSAVKKSQYNISALIPSMSLEEIKRQVDMLVLFPSKNMMMNKGHDFKRSQKKKVFVSYSHKNQEEVKKIISDLKSFGLSVWWDEQDINYGDSIMESIQNGIAESDLFLIFLSQNTLASFYAKEELKTFYNKIISDKNLSKKWFIVRLDDVNPAEMFLNLGDYKYYDLPSHDTSHLYKEISKKLSSL